MDSPDLNGLFEYFDKLISNSSTKLALLDFYYQNDKNECIEMNANIGRLQFLLHTIDQCLDEAENEFEIQSKRCVDILQLLEDHVSHIEANLPALKSKFFFKFSFKTLSVKFLLFSAEEKRVDNKSISRNVTYTNMDTKKIKKNNKSNIMMTNDKKNGHLATKPSSKATTKSSNSSPFPMMEHLTQAEYNSIPKYMLSRLTLSTLNESVDAFNHSIMCKYMFIRKFDLHSTKETEYKRYQEYKSHENADTKGKVTPINHLI